MERALASYHPIVSFLFFVVVEDIARRMYVRDTLDGEKMQEEINDLKMLLLAYKKGLIKEK